MPDDTEALIRKAQSRVSSTLSALEAAIASWDAMEKKPEQYAKTMSSMKRLHGRLEAWERNSLRNSAAPSDTKKKDLDALIAISESSKGDF